MLTKQISGRAFNLTIGFLNAHARKWIKLKLWYSSLPDFGRQAGVRRSGAVHGCAGLAPHSQQNFQFTSQPYTIASSKMCSYNDGQISDFWGNLMDRYSGLSQCMDGLMLG